MANESKNIRVGIVLAYINQFLSIGISLVYAPIMLGKLGQNEYGLYSIVQSLVSYLVLTDIGIGTTAIRYNAKYIADNDIEGQKRINGMFSVIFIAIAILCTVAGVVLYSFLDGIYAKYATVEIALIKRLFIIALINLVITFVFKIYNSIIFAYERFIFIRGLTLIQTIINPVALISVLYLGYGSIGLMLATTVFNLISCLIQYFFCVVKLNVKMSFENFNMGLFRKILVFTVFIFLNTLGTQLFNMSDKLFIGIVITSAAVSVFAIVQQLESHFYSFSNIVTAFYMPRLTKLNAVKDNKSQKDTSLLFIRIGRIQAVLAVLIYGGIAAFGKDFVFVWLGSDYDMVYPLLLIVLFPQVFGAAQSMFTQLMQAMNLHKARSAISVGVAVVKFAATYVVAKYFGLWGCACCYAVLYIVRMIAYHIYYEKKLDWSVSSYWFSVFKVYGILFLISTPLIIAGRCLPMLFTEVNYFVILLGVVFYAVLYFVLCWITLFNADEKGMAKSILLKVTGKLHRLGSRA